MKFKMNNVEEMSNEEIIDAFENMIEEVESERADFQCVCNCPCGLFSLYLGISFEEICKNIGGYWATEVRAAYQSNYYNEDLRNFFKKLESKGVDIDIFIEIEEIAECYLDDVYDIDEIVDELYKIKEKYFEA